MLSWKLGCRSIFIILSLVLLSACSQETRLNVDNFQVQFSRTGICITGDSPFTGDFQVFVSSDDGEDILQGSEVAGALIVPWEWKGGKTYQISIENYEGVIESHAPLKPNLSLVRKIDVSSELLKLKVGSGEDSLVSAAISSDKKWVALGSSKGKLLLLSTNTGRVVARLALEGAYIRSLVFHETSAGLGLLVGEQSPLGTVSFFAIDAEGKLRKEWRYQTATDIGVGAFEKGNPFSWAHMPGIYTILSRNRDDVFILALHSTEAGAEQATASRLYHLNGAGEVLWKWPAENNHPGVMTWLSADEAANHLVISSMNQDGTADVIIVDGATGKTTNSYRINKYSDSQSKVAFWKSVSINQAGSRASYITNDGRGGIIFLEDGSLKELWLGKPITSGDIPILVTGAAIHSGTDLLFYITGTTYLPWELAQGRKPPQAHHSANRVMAFSADGEERWRLSLPNLCQGVYIKDEPGLLLASHTFSPVYSSGGSNGVLLAEFDEREVRKVSSYLVAGNVMHGSPYVAGSDNLFLIVENFRRGEDGDKVEGSSAIHLLYW